MNPNTILIVDDDPTTTELLTEVLELQGYRCLTANSGKQALALFREKEAEIDIVLLDWLMPIMNGDETLVELRKIRPDVMVIMISAYGDRAHMTQSIQLGARGYIHKPIHDNGAELISKIGDLVHLKQLGELDHLAKMGRLAGNIAHYMRNNLWNINGRVQLLLEKEGVTRDPEVQTYLETIQRIATESNRVLYSLLHYGKKLPEEYSFTDLSPLQILDEIRTLYEPEIRRKKIELDVHSSLPEKILIKADRLQLGTAVMNILQNAVEAVNHEGRIEIATLYDTEAHKVSIHIRDNGAGIPEEAMGQLFKPFFTTKAEGIGLGLHVAREIILKHEGEIAVESNAGKGTTVRVVLNSV